MLIFFSPSREKAIFIKRMMLSSDIFAYQSSFPDLDSIRGIGEHMSALPSPPTTAIIDATENVDFGEKICRALKDKNPQTKCIVIIDKANYTDSRFKYLASSDAEVSIEPLSDLAPSLKCHLPKNDAVNVHEYKHLKLGKSRSDDLLLGYKLDLTESEHRILLFLCQNTDEAVSQHLILGFCFSEAYRMTETNVRTHVSSINKKAKAISGRKLILAERNKGYILNEYM